MAADRLESDPAVDPNEGLRSTGSRNVVSTTVTRRIILHGVSANPLIARNGVQANVRQPIDPPFPVSELPEGPRTISDFSATGVGRAG